MTLDICERKHHGATTSQQANQTVDKQSDRLTVFSLIQNAEPYGLTLHECCEILGRTPNNLSGRFSELLYKFNAIEYRGTREVHGHRGRVYHVRVSQ